MAGRAAAIKVLAVRPSGSWDAEVETYFEREIARWRWNPSDEAVRVHRMVMPVTARGPQGERFGQALLRAPTNTEERAPWFSRPLDEQVVELERLLAIVQKHLEAPATRRIETPRFVVLSDYGHSESVAALASNLEAAIVTLDGMFESIEPQPLPTRTIAVICRDEAAFFGLMRDFGIYDPRVQGIFRSPGLLVFHAAMATPEELLSVMLHEATHVWTERLITRPGLTTPEWLSEGWPSTSATPASGAACSSPGAPCETATPSATTAGSCAARPAKAGRSTASDVSTRLGRGFRSPSCCKRIEPCSTAPAREPSTRRRGC